jgi:CRP-like cAMP-binding protein
MANPAIEKLKLGGRLAEADAQAIEAVFTDVRVVPAREDVISEGERPEAVHVVLEGFACRYKLLPDGGRQIMAWLVPGDFCDLHVAVLGTMDHSIATLTASRIAYVSQRDVEELTTQSPALSRALWWATLVDESVLREWLVNMGRRPADRQIAHLLCELLLRLQCVGCASENEMELPVTQVELADTVGLSSVHVNRVIQQLREEGLITWRGRLLTIHDVPALQAFAGFDPNYLHLTPRAKGAEWAKPRAGRAEAPRRAPVGVSITPADAAPRS